MKCLIAFRLPALVVLLAIFGAARVTFGAEDVIDPGQFDADGDGLLSIAEASQYLVAKYKIVPNLSDTNHADGAAIDANGKFIGKALLPNSTLDKAYIEERSRESIDSQIAKRRGALRERAKADAYPISLNTVRKIEGVEIRNGEAVAIKSGPLKIPGIFQESAKFTNGAVKTAGPIFLRKSGDEWEKPLTDAAGAKFSYADNRLQDQTTFTTEGALLYPIAFRDRDPEETAPALSSAFTALPSINWKLINTAQTNVGDIEEMRLQVAVSYGLNHSLPWLRNSHVALTPYYQTDFSLDGHIVGAKLTYIPYIQQAVPDTYNGPIFALNTGFKGLTRTSPVMYRLGLVPTIDFNHLFETSRFIERSKHDGYLRTGAKVEAALRTVRYPSLELLASYEFFAGLVGAPDYSKLLSLSSKLWLNDYAGFSFEYQRGDTPIAQKKIDLLTVGIELRF